LVIVVWLHLNKPGLHRSDKILVISTFGGGATGAHEALLKPLQKAVAKAAGVDIRVAQKRVMAAIQIPMRRSLVMCIADYFVIQKPGGGGGGSAPLGHLAEAINKKWFVISCFM
jgi:hypothetical protein